METPSKDQEVTFKLEGMGCSCEAKIVEKRLKALKGIKTYNINPISNWLKITFDSSLVTTDTIKKEIGKCGITASPIKK
ncbi:MAG: heavy-metal-associated domain-containing protein [Candidatus Bathyarchaeota archaeon]|nr:heavy-metal-associated domain-containing protein [Candidatus Bathyarchaeota archaeon]